jgi:Transposase DDE domain
MYDAADVEPAQVATEVRQDLMAFLQPLLARLDAQIDRRLVQTFARTVDAILCFRNRPHGLLLSELGGYLLDPEHAAAGTKRLSNLLRSGKWSASLSEDFLWLRSTHQLEELEQQGEEALVLWDESVLEKPESIATPDLGSVRSSKAHRLTRIKPGFYHPPGRPIFVPGFQWIGLLLAGIRGTPSVAALQWWTNRGEHASDKRTEETALLQRCLDAWGRRVCHVFDRGFAGTPWLRLLISAETRFILRWPARYKLADGAGTQHHAWQLVRGKRAWDHRLLWDARHHCSRKTGILAVPVLWEEHSLVLIVARRGAGQQPWYLLTNEPVATSEELWRIVLSYARRWQLEMVWRYNKSELAMESVRVWTWERRKKLLLLAALAYAFLISLLSPSRQVLRTWLLDHWCHRTGKRSRDAPTPLYRLRSALSRLWLAYPWSSHAPLLETPG